MFCLSQNNIRIDARTYQNAGEQRPGFEGEKTLKWMAGQYKKTVLS